MRSILFSYLFFFQDENAPMHKKSTLIHEKHESSLQTLLKGYVDCFAKTNQVELPSSRGEDDHMIDLILGTSMPNRPPYRVSMCANKPSAYPLPTLPCGSTHQNPLEGHLIAYIARLLHASNSSHSILIQDIILSTLVLVSHILTSTHTQCTHPWSANNWYQSS